MGALGHYLEQAGLPTTQISLVREHTEALMPPRALWVSFMLGRPFGVPGDAAFQLRVLMAALSLLERDGVEPLLEDFGEEAPHEDLGDAAAGAACPVSFPSSHRSGEQPLATAFIEEAEQIGAWHALSRDRLGRTGLGLTGRPIDEVVRFIVAYALGNPAMLREDLPLVDALKLACDELRVYYEEARAMQPGRHSSTALRRWFWGETAAGLVVRQVRDRVVGQAGDPDMQKLAGQLVPRLVDVEDDAAPKVVC